MFSQSITQLVDRTQTSLLVPPDSRTNMGCWRQEHPVVLGDRPGLGRTFTSHRLRPPDPLCLRRPPPLSLLLLPRPRPIIRSSSGEIGNLTRGRRCKCMRFLERAWRYFRAASSKSEDGRLGDRDRERVVGRDAQLPLPECGGWGPPEMDEVIGGGGGGTAPNTEWRLARAKSILHFSSFLEWPSSVQARGTCPLPTTDRGTCYFVRNQ